MSFEEYDWKKIGLFSSFILILIGGIIGGASGLYYHKKYQETEQRFRQASAGNQEDVQTLIAKVGKLIKLPDGEMPTIATVTDLERLKSQPFFARAKVGDRVLLYPVAKKAFLYDPVGNVIVEVGPLIIPTPSLPIANVTSSADVAGLATQITPTILPVNLAIYNATTVSNLADQFANELTGKIQNLKIIEKTNSKKKDYAKSVIIDLTGKNKALIESISGSFNLSVSALPSEEKSPPGAEVLIILAPDRLTN